MLTRNEIDFLFDNVGSLSQYVQVMSMDYSSPALKRRGPAEQ